ncbi:MAG: HD-GYP domain-containing protein [Clostridiaceae bacterium]|nr:HD-GYP domain-containing protein [Clostridiaceae bacterium]
MRLIPINCVKENSFLGKTIYDAEGRALLHKGTRITNGLIKRIKNIGIQAIYIIDEYSSNEIEDIIKPEVRMKAIKVIKDTFEYLEQYSVDKGKINLNGAHRKRSIIYRDKYIDSLMDVSKLIVDEVLLNKDVLINLVDIKSMDNYTYEHSVNVAVLSLVIGVEQGLSIKELHDLCVGALLHDVGKAFIPNEILKKPYELTEDEFELMKQHPVKGYEYIKSNISLSAVTKVIVLEHHERMDGGGYPRNLDRSKIHSATRIVTVADVYDALTSHRPYRTAILPNEAIELIMGSAGRHFDFKIAYSFVRKVVPYPVGTVVKLSNGYCGVVEDIPVNYPLRPRLRLIRSNLGETLSETIDLLKEKNIVITGVQFEVPEQV